MSAIGSVTSLLSQSASLNVTSSGTHARRILGDVNKPEFVIAALAIGLLATGCSASAPQWVWPTPFPLPSGAQAVPLAVGQPYQPPADAGIVDTCPANAVPRFVVEYDPDDSSPVRYRFATGYEPVVWGVGFSARLNPRLEIVAPDGAIITREDEALEGMLGGYFDDALHVCVHSYAPQRQR
jgi:hypothetical protein